MNKQCGIVGSPISHSKSPSIHSAAYRVLGLDWSYERNEVGKGGLATYVAKLPSSWLGLSVTMPLKNEAFQLAAKNDRWASLTGSTNTLIQQSDGTWSGYNTDVFGIIKAVQAKRREAISTVLILGSGATAMSAVAATATLAPGAKVKIFARNKKTRKALLSFARQLGLSASRAWFFESAAQAADLVVSTLPARAMDKIANRLNQRHLWKPSGLLLDVAYDPWPSNLAKLWQDKDLPVASGLDMLIWQAVAQIRLFTSGNAEQELSNEVAIVEAMRIATAN